MMHVEPSPDDDVWSRHESALWRAMFHTSMTVAIVAYVWHGLHGHVWFNAATPIFAFVWGWQALYEWRSASMPSTLLLAIRPDAVHVFARGTTWSVSYANVQRAEADYGNAGSWVRLYFRRSAPFAVRLPYLLGGGVKSFRISSVDHARWLAGYVNERIAESGSTRKIRATSAS